MVDTINKAKRSKLMAKIRSSGNGCTELKLVAIMRANGITGWRRKQALPGKPDFVFPKSRVAVFVDGCFWHGCKKHCRMPHSHRIYWERKIKRNTVRDRMITQLLFKTGWRVIRIWEHSLACEKRIVNRLGSALKSRQ